MQIPFDLLIVLINMYPTEIPAHVQDGIRVRLLTAAWLVPARVWNSPCVYPQRADEIMLVQPNNRVLCGSEKSEGCSVT